jgi:hypothetical protein
MQDVKNTISSTITVAPVAMTNGTAASLTTTGLGADLAGFAGACVIVATGVVTDGTHTVEVQDSADNTTFAAVSDTLLTGTEPAIVAADDATTFEIGYQGVKRYLRANIVTTGATTGAVIGAIVVRTGGRKQPI